MKPPSCPGSIKLSKINTNLGGTKEILPTQRKVQVRCLPKLNTKAHLTMGQYRVIAVQNTMCCFQVDYVEHAFHSCEVNMNLTISRGAVSKCCIRHYLVHYIGLHFGLINTVRRVDEHSKWDKLMSHIIRYNCTCAIWSCKMSVLTKVISFWHFKNILYS